MEIENEIDLNKNIDEKINKLLNKNNTDITNLVLSGGGIRGIAHIGAIKYLEENKIMDNIKVIAGTSIGGIVAGLTAIGYSADDLMNFIELFDINKIKSFCPEQFLNSFGLDDGQKLIVVLEKMFETKNISINITFKELFDLKKIKLILTGVCLNNKQTYYFSYLTEPEMPIILAMRITSSLPCWFVPVKYNNMLFIDGGCIDNYPIKIFSNELNNTIGLFLKDNNEYEKNIVNIEQYFLNLIECFLKGLTCNLVCGFEKQTINIDIKDVSLMNLNINTEIKHNLFNYGYSATKDYFA
jgi:NTE family protein